MFTLWISVGFSAEMIYKHQLYTPHSTVNTCYVQYVISMYLEDPFQVHLRKTLISLDTHEREHSLTWYKLALPQLSMFLVIPIFRKGVFENMIHRR